MAAPDRRPGGLSEPGTPPLGGAIQPRTAGGRGTSGSRSRADRSIPRAAGRENDRPAASAAGGLRGGGGSAPGRPRPPLRPGGDGGGEQLRARGGLGGERARALAA